MTVLFCYSHSLYSLRERQRVRQNMIDVVLRWSSTMSKLRMIIPLTFPKGFAEEDASSVPKRNHFDE
ncbi:hypothetical protein GCK32_014170 [Trichostrongylus colubriformis]|uniref:Uncharacterized protein n=1 Tax=Trichostrongylus colubriformis TaxID=6319 RepID=A0AAN8IUW5_TRICO